MLLDLYADMAAVDEMIRSEPVEAWMEFVPG